MSDGIRQQPQSTLPFVALGWLALLVLQQTASVLLIDAGPGVSYQHYPPYDQLFSGSDLPLLAAILVHSAIVLSGLLHLRRHSAHWRLPTLARWRWVALTAIFVLTGAALSKRIDAYVGELLLASLVQVSAVGNAALVALAVPDGLLARIRTWLGPADPENDPPDPAGRPGRIDPVVVAVAAWVLVAATVLVWVSYQRHPHIPDEVSYLIQARYFAEGKLALPAPPLPEAFDVDLMMHQDGTWLSPMLPGWPAVLALGVIAGVPWLINPLCGAVNVLLAWALIRRLYGFRTARLVVVLLGLSPWHTFMAMSYMSHTFTLTCMLAAAVALARLTTTGRIAWAWIGGAATGLVSAMRPLDGLAVAIPLGLWALATGGRRFRLAPAFGFGLGAMLTGSLQLLYNAALTGSFSSFPVMEYADRLYGAGSNSLGFGPEKGFGWPGLDPFPGHGAIDVLVNANLNLFAINVELFGWASGSMLLIGWWLVDRGRWTTGDRVLVGLAASVIGLHTFYWFAGGPDFGARYWYLVIVPFTALSARGLERLARTWGRGATDRPTAPRLIVAFAALTLAATVTFVPWRAVDKYFHYRGMRPDVRELAAERGFGRSLVIVRGERHPDYASAAVYNPLDLLRNDVPVYVWDRSRDVRRKAVATYPDRSIWVLDGPSVTGSGFKVAGGPYDRAELPDWEFAPEDPEPAGGLQ